MQWFHESEDETTTWTYWALYAREPTGGQGVGGVQWESVICICLNDWSWLPKGLWVASTQWRQDRLCLKCLHAQLLSHVQLFVTPWTATHQVPLPHGISQARIQEWVAISLSRVSSQPRDWLESPALAGEFFTTKTPGKPVSNSKG